MPAIVSEVVENSIAQELEIVSGDEILSIDDMKMQDMIDYNFMCKSDFLTLEIKKTNGEIEVIELEKDYDEDLGIVFESAIFDKIKPCLNHCIFCFGMGSERADRTAAFADVLARDRSLFFFDAAASFAKRRRSFGAGRSESQSGYKAYVLGSQAPWRES